MARIKTGFVSGTVTDSPLTVGATTLNSAGLADLPVISSPDIAAIVLDPNGSAGAPEIVWVTNHTASATSATISRGQEGTVAREHLAAVAWIHGPTLEDFKSGTKEFMVTPVYSTVLQSGGSAADGGNEHTSALSGNFRGIPLTSIDVAYFIFHMPHDFVTLEEAVVIGVADATETIQWDVTATPAAAGEAYSQTSTSLSNQTKSAVANRMEEMDVSGALNNVVANDYVGVSFSSDTNNLYPFGLRIKYS